MKSTYVGTRSANMGDIRCSFALASDSTSKSGNGEISLHTAAIQWIQ